MFKHVIYGSFGLLAATVLALAIYMDKPVSAPLAEAGSYVATTTEQAATVAVADEGAYYAVVKVIDGDTITVDMGRKTETIRFIGVDSPETGTEGECYAAESTNEVKKLLSGRKVRLELDQSQGERDRYGRLLAYVHREDGLHVNGFVVKEGLAREYTYNKPYRYQKEFKVAETAAKSGGIGIWNTEACRKPTPPRVESAEPPQTAEPATNGQPSVPVPQTQEESQQKASQQVAEQPESPPPAPPTPPPASSSYTCSANTYNCSDFSTQAEAQTVFDQCGGSSNDIHRLDSNKDGEACESLP